MTSNYREMLDGWALALAALAFHAIAPIVAAVANLSRAVPLDTAPAHPPARHGPGASAVPNGDDMRRNPGRCCGGRV